MRNLFEHTSAPWIRYSNYEYKTDSKGDLYITVSKDAKPEMYHPMQEAEPEDYTGEDERENRCLFHFHNCSYPIFNRIFVEISFR